MDDVNIEDERECHLSIVFEENYGGLDDKNELLHAKKWDVYVNEKKKFIKGGY